MNIPPGFASHQGSCVSLSSFYAKVSRHTPTILRKKGRDSGGGGADRDELVPVNSRGNAYLAIIGSFHANHLAVTADVHIPSGNHLLRESENKINFGAILKTCFRHEIKSAVTDVPCAGSQFWAVCVMRQYTNRQGHHKATCFTPIG